MRSRNLLIDPGTFRPPTSAVTPRELYCTVVSSTFISSEMLDLTSLANKPLLPQLNVAFTSLGCYLSVDILWAKWSIALFLRY
jgi:hypothetical protein